MTSRGSIPADVWADPRVQHYLREGHFGWLHHRARTRRTDALLFSAAVSVGYSADEMVGLLIGCMGRYVGDEIAEESPLTHDAVERMLRPPSRREMCSGIMVAV